MRQLRLAQQIMAMVTSGGTYEISTRPSRFRRKRTHLVTVCGDPISELHRAKAEAYQQAVSRYGLDAVTAYLNEHHP